VGRYGGEEFLIVLPDSDFESARNRAEQLCRAVQSAQVVDGETLVQVTSSFGVASGFPGKDQPARAAVLRSRTTESPWNKTTQARSLPPQATTKIICHPERSAGKDLTSGAQYHPARSRADPRSETRSMNHEKSAREGIGRAAAEKDSKHAPPGRCALTGAGFSPRSPASEHDSRAQRRPPMKMSFSPCAQAMPRSGMTEKATAPRMDQQRSKRASAPEVLYHGTTSVVPKDDRP
jgi:hypothetical protein